MKKIVTIVAAALVASAAFAQVSIGAWGRALWSPIAYDGKDAVSLQGTSWNANGDPRVGFTVAGNSDNVGFVVDITGENVGTGDCAYAWVKPIDMLTIKIGRIHDDTLRGNGAYGLFNYQRIGAGWTGEDFTFSRIGAVGGKGGELNGAVVTLTPVEGLFIGLGTNVDGTANKLAGGPAGVINTAQFAVGYTIANVGKVRAQLLGNGNAEVADDDFNLTTVYNGYAEAAFDLTAVENLFVTIGARVPFAQKAMKGDLTDIYGNNTEVNLYANYKVSALTIHALVGTKIGVHNKNYLNSMTLENAVDNLKKYRDGDAFGFMVGAGIDYAFENGLGIVADVRYQDAVYGTSDSKGKDSLVFLAALEKGFSNGKFGIGFEGGTNNAGPASGTDASAFTFSVPVKAEYWF